MQDIDKLISFDYKEQIDVGKDECYYEIRRFLQLLQSANPTVLELLYSPKDCIVKTSPQFELLVQHRDKLRDGYKKKIKNKNIADLFL